MSLNNIKVLASPCLSYFLHIPYILFSVPPLNLLACASLREPRWHWAICGFCARFAIDVNMEMGKIVLIQKATDIYLPMFKMTKNLWPMNSIIKHCMPHTSKLHSHKAFSQCSSKSVHFQFIGLLDIYTFISQVMSGTAPETGLMFFVNQSL